MEIFKDNNNWNEKSIIGAIAFVIMCMVMILDLLTGWLGRDLAINEFVYDSLIVTGKQIENGWLLEKLLLL